MAKPLLIALVFLLASFVPVDMTRPGASSLLNMNQTLRADLIFSGDNIEQKSVLFRFSRDNGWSGSANQLISPFDYGEYRFFLIHESGGDTLFARGFSNLFEEWRTTNEAKFKAKAFQQTLVMPFPKQTSRLVIEARRPDGSFYLLMEESINPHEIELNKPVRSNFEIKIIHGDDAPAQKNDLLFLSEGYNFNELDKFSSDAKNLTNQLFSIEPYKSLKKNFTVRTLAIASPESGVTDPLTGTWKDTYFKSRFNTFGIDRYLQTKEIWRIYETAALAPYDHIIILVNSRKYGGGGIYNHFSILTSDSSQSGDLLAHELGHSLAGLGDEYFDSDVAYVEYINLNIEPWQPNLTTLVNFDKKWKNLLNPSTPIPTPVRPAFEKTIGVFEGGGYVSKGIYRPALYCRMRSSKSENFCEVCSRTITEVTNFYTK
jgi:hypothetical protein